MFQFRYEFIDGRITTYDFAANVPVYNSERQVLALESEAAVQRLREMLNVLCAKTWPSEHECSQALMRVAAGA